MAHVTHRFNVYKWKKEEEAEKEKKIEKLQEELQELHRSVLDQDRRILAIEKENAGLTKQVTMLQRIILDQAEETEAKEK
ncbi:hypothetical protein VN97_g10516 [Penicillium thymicola]|uniref:Uncharacterized protein n=1 Tax=Penicillium thymicola TaxID=293382 RepID=A0AAI9T8U5_PENTH|nr:hypothetical protein VN97_g10516 [Penicillium thymicola]